MAGGRVLVVDDEPGIRAFVADVLADDGHAVTQAADGEAAARLLDAHGFDVVVTDLRMPGAGGMALVRRVRAAQPEVEVVVMTAHGTVDTAIEAMKLGAFDYLRKPLAGPEELSIVVARALERRRLRDRITEDGPRREGGAAGGGATSPGDVGAPGGVRLGHGDPAMRPVVDAIGKVARTAATVLLLGESGSGKEVAARAIHAASERAAGPFTAINCAALTDTLLESELFGHEKGAFTGASERRRGRIELGAGGSFFLDEIGELRPELQAKLLRVLQEKTFERVGGAQTLVADVRWIAATNRDLEAMMRDGRFREDLYHRLAVFPIRLPPLRERPADLLPIARALLTRVAGEVKRGPLALTADAERALAGWRWPGNVRELANVLERAAILADGPTIDAENLGLPEPQPAPPAAPSAGDGLTSLAELERAAIERTLAAVGGNRRRASEILGIGERTLYDKLKRHGLA